MNPDSKRMRLLNDVLAREQTGDQPSASSVIELLRREKAMRKRRRSVVCTAALTGLMITAMTLARHAGPSSRGQASHLSSGSFPPVRSEAAPPEIEIEQIGDEQLLELLADQPVALVQLPDGARRLMLVIGSRPGAQEF